MYAEVFVLLYIADRQNNEGVFLYPQLVMIEIGNSSYLQIS
jgi:hypothetical protein